MSTTSSRNFTTLYSGSGSVVPQGAYGNANVVSLLSVGTDGGNTVTGIVATGNISTTTSMSAQGNVTAAYFIGNGSLLTNINAGNITGNVNFANTAGTAQFVTGNAQANITSVGTLTSLTATGNVVGGNISTTGLLSTGVISSTGNVVTDGFFVGNFVGNITGNLTVPGLNTQVLYNDAGNAGASAGLTFTSTSNALVSSGTITSVGNVVGGNLTTVGQVSAAGNITGNYILGNGSQLTGLPAIYGNANVATFLAAFGSNTISSTGNITTTANIAGGFFLGNGSQLTGLPATYSNANVVALMAAFGSNVISTTGNVTAGNFIGNGQYLTNINAGNITGLYGNANVSAYLASGTNTANIITTGNIASGNISTTGKVSVGGTISTVGDISIGASTLISTGALIAFAGTPAYIGSYNTGNTLGNALGYFDGANGKIQLYNPALASNGWVFNNADGNLTLPGNTSAINYANGVNILTSAVGTYNNANVADFLANSFGSNTIVTTGNITGGNLVASANLTSTQQTVIGTANVGTTGNIVVSGRNIATDMKFNPDGATGTALYTGRVMVGTGWLGNNAVGISSRLASMDTIDRSNTASQVRQIEAETQVNLTGNVSNTSFRQQAIGGRIRIGGGAAANTIGLTSTGGTVFNLAAGQFNLDIGNVSPYFLGNTVVGHAALNSGALTLNGGSSIGNAYGYVPALFSGGSGASNVTNYIGVASSVSGANVTGNLFCFYNGNNTSLGSYGVQISGSARQATNYYFLRNDDDVAQVKLGSLRSYNEFQYATATSGTVNIDKNNAQVQFIAPTANVTIGDYQNFVTTANDSVNNDTQTDTVTLIIQQGATPYTITMPTGNAAIKYASNVTTVGATANSVTMVSISAFRSTGNAAIYLTTVSPEFV